MRLLDTKTGKFLETKPGTKKYAILSHTWDNEKEQTYKELKKIQRRYSLEPHHHDYFLQDHPNSIWNDPELSPKIRNACAVALENNYQYIWIDSCCIDKSSSAELSEAINSMYAWYAAATVCYAYLSDVPAEEDHWEDNSKFRISRWFTRVWTLQDLIAPLHVIFLSEDWASIGSKQALVNLLESVTGVNSRALLFLKPLHEFSVAQRLSWAARRNATRTEDRAYSLLGIFDINMPTLYGEGYRAFRRLQEKILERIPDESLFAWGELYPVDPHKGLQTPDLNITSIVVRPKRWEWGPSRSPTLFSFYPGDFATSGSIHAIPLRGAFMSLVASPGSTSPTCGPQKMEYESTPYGIRTKFWMIPLTQCLPAGTLLPGAVEFDFPEDCSKWYLAVLGCGLRELPEHHLGRVCFIPPSNSDVELVYAGYIEGLPPRDDNPSGCFPDLFTLSPQTLERCRSHIELKTVHLPHYTREDELPWNELGNMFQPQGEAYTTLKLVLLKETSDALYLRGYLARLHDPVPNTWYRLTLSKNEYTIAVQFEHTLAPDGKQFTIEAKVDREVSSPTSSPLNSIHDQLLNHGIVSWSAQTPWRTHAGLGHKRAKLSPVRAETLIIDLDLECVGTGVYVLWVDVLSDDIESSVVEQERTVEVGFPENERKCCAIQ